MPFACIPSALKGQDISAQGKATRAITTRGGAALCPGLICFGPFGATERAIQLRHHHRPVICPGPFGATHSALEDPERRCHPFHRIPRTGEFR